MSLTARYWFFVTLIACESAAGLMALGSGMPPVIAMRAAISCDVARAFAQGFYEGIAAGRDRMRLLGMGDEDVPALMGG